MQEIRNSLKWGDGKTIKNVIDLQILDLLGQNVKNDFILTKEAKQIDLISKSDKHNGK
jgi:hypothetical protein